MMVESKEWMTRAFFVLAVVTGVSLYRYSQPDSVLVTNPNRENTLPDDSLKNRDLDLPLRCQVSPSVNQELTAISSGRAFYLGIPFTPELASEVQRRNDYLLRGANSMRISNETGIRGARKLSELYQRATENAQLAAFTTRDPSLRQKLLQIKDCLEEKVVSANQLIRRQP